MMKPGHGRAQVAGTTVQNSAYLTSGGAQICSLTVWQSIQSSMHKVYEKENFDLSQQHALPSKFVCVCRHELRLGDCSGHHLGLQLVALIAAAASASGKR